MKNIFGPDHDPEKKAAFKDVSPASMAGAKGEQEARAAREEGQSFKLALDFEGQHYDGMITPASEKGVNGMPVFFRVVIGDELFAYLCCADHGWYVAEEQGQPKDLVNAIGNYIMDYYE
jgi:hypothetical protein